MSQQSHWKCSGICSWERGGGEVITFTFEHCNMKFMAALHMLLPCLGLSAFLFHTDNCVVSNHLLCRELSPTVLSMNPRQIQQHCFQCQERPEQWPSAGCHVQAGVEMFWLLCDIMDCPVSSKARLLFLKTKLRLFVSACCSESWAGYKTILSFQSHQW